LYKTFLLFVSEFSNAFSAPAEFSGGVQEKYFRTGWSRTFDLQITNQMLYQWATAVYALALVHAVAGSHAFLQVFLYLFLDLPLLAYMVLPYSMMLPAPMLLQVFLPGIRPFTFPNAGKFWSLEPGQNSLQEPDFYGMEECKMSHSGDRKTFPAFGNAKGLLPGTRRVF
jgi:hypothetical protein